MILLTHRITPEPQKFVITPHQQALLMPIGDIQYGTPTCDIDRLRRHLAWGIDVGAYFVGMGDYLDFTSPTQRTVLSGMRLSQVAAISGFAADQLGQFTELPEVQASVGRWLGLLEGHHFYQAEDGVTTDQRLCEFLQAPFLGTSALIDVLLRYRNGRTSPVRIWCHHGTGGGRRRGSHLARLEDMIIGIDADVYLMGHSTSKVSDPVDRLYRTAAGGTYHRTLVLARTGGFNRAYVGLPAHRTGAAMVSRGDYAEKAAYAPASLGGVVISLGLKRVQNGTGVDVIIPDLHYSV